MSTAGAAHSQHWYAEVSGGPLRQGDVIRGLAVPWFPVNLEIPAAVSSEAIIQLDARVTIGTWIILDASCDLDQKRCPHLVIAPVKEATLEALGAQKEKDRNERLEILRRGLYEARFLLADKPDATPPFPISFVEFRQHLLVPLEYVEHNATRPWLRLKAPIREQFGNWVGACFARVGPENEVLIPAFVPAFYDAQKLKATDGMTAHQSVARPRVASERSRSRFVDGVVDWVKEKWRRLRGS